MINVTGKGHSFHHTEKTEKKIEQNNKTIVLNILSLQCSTETISPAYKSKYNDKRANQFFVNDY